MIITEMKKKKLEKPGHPVVRDTPHSVTVILMLPQSLSDKTQEKKAKKNENCNLAKPGT